MQVKIDARKAQAGLNGIADVIPKACLVGGKNAGESGAEGARKRAHKVSGRMIRETGVKINEPYITRFGSDAPYALLETSREGHDFIFAELHRMENGAFADYVLAELNSMAPRSR